MITELYKSSPSAVIELFELDLSPIAGFYSIPSQDQHLYFHAGTNQLGSNVVWQGNTYARWPVEINGIEVRTGGELPRPTFSLSNLSLFAGGLVKAYADMIGCNLVRKRTFVKFLDAVNFTGGTNPTADPNAFFPSDVFKIDRKASENHLTITFELAVPWDVEGVTLPRRQIISSICPWKYKGALDSPVNGPCGYAGTLYWKADDTTTVNANEDNCGKRESSCRLRHGNTAIPFGGFPGVGLIAKTS